MIKTEGCGLYVIFKTSANDNFSNKHFGLWSIILSLIYTDTVFAHTNIQAYIFTYGINVRVVFTRFSIKDFLHKNIKLEINKEFRTEHEYLVFIFS